MAKNISFTKGKPIFIVDIILIPLFVLLFYSGLKLHVAGHTDNHSIWEYWAWFHVIVSLPTLIAMLLHIKAHWSWYKSLVKKGMKNKSKITIIISILFLILTITGILLMFFIEGANSAVGLWHYKLGIVMGVLALFHIIGRFKIMIKGLGWKKKNN
jgi:hypothetical protein